MVLIPLVFSVIESGFLVTREITREQFLEGYFSHLEVASPTIYGICE